MTLQKEKGFTLIEVAIVMIIIGLVMGGGLAIMRTLTDRKFRNESIDHLNNAKKALITFAQINGRLPWADTNNDGDEDSAQIGSLPWNTIGVAPFDPYGRRVVYEANPGVCNSSSPLENMVDSCNVLMAPLSGRPEILDADAGAGTEASAAAVLISAGAMNADNAGGGATGVFDAIAGGNNITGNPYYVRNPPVEGTFDDLAVYVTGNELFGEICEIVFLGVNYSGSTGTFYIRDMTRDVNLGSDADAFPQTYTLISGTQIGVFSNSNGTGPIIPPTPISLSGQDQTITIP